MLGLSWNSPQIPEVEKMLRSQQLTFAFVGVAPSLIVVIGMWRWLRDTLFPGTTGKLTVRERRKAWSSIR